MSAEGSGHWYTRACTPACRHTRREDACRPRGYEATEWRPTPTPARPWDLVLSVLFICALSTTIALCR